jgi:shikimate kinase
MNEKNWASAHIVLCGFKHVGKSTVGRLLAQRCGRLFIDLDTQIEKNYQRHTRESLSCREIYDQYGDAFFRECETTALSEVLQNTTAVIALGGGALFSENNRALLAPYPLIGLSAPPSVVYARLIATGKPAYFPQNEDPEPFFHQRWRQHEALQAQTANYLIDNISNPEQTVEHILKWIENRC